VANAREGRLNECDPYFSTIESQTIYGGGGIQVAEVGAIDANKIQQFCCIWQHIFKFLLKNPLSYFRVPFLIGLLAKILTKKTLYCTHENGCARVQLHTSGWSPQGLLKKIVTASDWPAILIHPSDAIFKWSLTLDCPVFHVYGWGRGKQLIRNVGCHKRGQNR
jgi:hypothetical protein